MFSFLSIENYTKKDFQYLNLNFIFQIIIPKLKKKQICVQFLNNNNAKNNFSTIIFISGQEPKWTQIGKEKNSRPS